MDAAVPGVGRTANFTVTVSGGDSQTFAWDFGDGNTATTTTSKTSHVYLANGQYTATVTVTTTDGRTATGRVEFIVSGI
jgi:cytochrome c